MTLNILHLVLFSHDSGLYDVMYHITRKYYHTFENIKTVYYCFDENITDNYSLIDDILYIKGTEGYIPNILDKTIKAFQYFNEKTNYDYIVRSNISSIINCKLLISILTNNKIQYGGKIWNIPPKTLHYKGHICLIPDNIDTLENIIIDTNLWGVNFTSGTCIILSKESVEYLLNTNIRYELIDDVAIGVALHKKINISDLTNYYIDTETDSSNFLIYRHRSDNRFNDIYRMIKIIELLISS